MRRTRIRVGRDPKAIAELYERIGPTIYRRCLKLLRDPERARDATQDVFVKVVREAPRIEEMVEALPWIYRTATNHCLNLLRDANRRREPSWSLAVVEQGAPPEYPSRVVVQGLLNGFDGVTQLIAVGVLVDGMEQQEVAAVMGISSKTVSRKLKRFLDTARERLKEGET